MPNRLADFIRKVPSLVAARFMESPMATMRQFFHWKYSSFFIAAWIGAGLTMLSINHFTLVYVCFISATVWAGLCWWFSETLEKKAVAVRKLKSKADRIDAKPKVVVDYETARKKLIYWKFMPLMILLLFLLFCCNWVHERKIEYQLTLWKGRLEPDSLPTPDNACSGFNKNTSQFMTLLLGDDAAYADQFPHTVIMVRGKDELVLDKDGEGRIAVTVNIFDKDGRVVAFFERGEFQVNQSNVSAISRPDLHTLIVTDEYKNEALYVHYLNKNTLHIGARLFNPAWGSRPVLIPKEISPGTCRGRNVPADIIIP